MTSKHEQITAVPKLLTVTKLCSRLGVTRWTLNRWIERGVFTVPAVAINGRDYFDEVEVRAWVQAKKGGAQ
jgi:excisionase family DNA binding protein